MALTYDKLNETQKKNAALINAALTKYGITNPYLRAGVLAVVAKESQFIPKNEISYAGTSNSRIREVFGSRVSNLSEAQLTALKKDPRAFFNRIYGGQFSIGKQLGNTQPNDGYNYRGRGFNQNTGRGNYTMLTNKSGIDLVSNPDRMNDPAVAAEALAIFFSNGLASGLKKYKVADQNKIDSLRKGTDIAYNINAGIGNNPSADTTGGYKQSLDSMSSYLKSLGDLSEIQKKTGFGLIVLLALGGGIYYYLKKNNLLGA
jgi:predicted chitinase